MTFAFDCTIALLHQFLPFDLRFVRKGCIWSFKTAVLQQFLALDLISCEKVNPRLTNFAFPHAFVHLTRTISADECSRTNHKPDKVTFHRMFVRPTRTICFFQANKARISPPVCASNTHDLRRRLPPGPTQLAFHHKFWASHTHDLRKGPGFVSRAKKVKLRKFQK